MKKLIIIGANNFQVPLIKKANEMGLETHVFAWEKGAVGKRFADFFYPISITDKESILQEAEKIKPDGVTSIGSDLATLAVNFLADRLHLIGNSLECTQVSTNKCAMRGRLSQAGLPCPKYSQSDDMEIIRNTCGEFPLIVKPTDRSGSRGVTLVRNELELQLAIVQAQVLSFTFGHIVEQFVSGSEYSIEMISWQGVHHFLQITEKETSGVPHFVEKSHHQPATLATSIIAKIVQIVDKALTALQVTNGASHSEVLVTDTGEIFIVEIGARMGGDYIGSHLVELSTGYDYLKGTIEVALGSFNVPVKNEKMYAGIYYVFGKPGLLSRITDNSKKYKEIVTSEVYYQLGAQLREVTESNDRAACYIYRSSNGKFVVDDEIIII